MATLTIKNIPDELYQDLKNQALHHRRSINNEAIVSLERALHQKKLEATVILENARKLRAKTRGHFLTEKELHAAKNSGRL